MQKSVIKFTPKKLVNNIKLWRKLFPNITPYYAVKCNNNQNILNIFNQNKVNFDCASKLEIQQVIQMPMYKKDKIIFANPVKIPHELKYAHNKEINFMTADSHQELQKIAKYAPGSNVLLRIAVDDSKSICRFNKKFGIPIDNNSLNTFFNESKKIKNVEISGIAFHVGSGCYDSKVYTSALHMCNFVKIFAKKYNVHMNIIDIGGGFVNKQPFIQKVAKTIAISTHKIWDKNNMPTFIAEPGRFFVGNTCDLYVEIIGKKIENNIHKYYVNDSVYNTFNCKIFDHAKFTFTIHKKIINNTQLHNSIIFGATCDSMDTIIENIQIPKLDIGDILQFHNMGAYTTAAASGFNGIQKAIFKNK
jgi:ornithine decarboxylase